MARLLYIEASPRKKRSASIEAARTFISEYERTHPEDVVETLDLWQLTFLSSMGMLLIQNMSSFMVWSTQRNRGRPGKL